MKSTGMITCSDANMLPAACVALLSFHRNLTRRDIRFFLLGIDLDDASASEVERFARFHSITIELLSYRTNGAGTKTLGRWSQATMARLYMDQYLPGEIETLLYVDADVLAISNVDAVFDTDFRGSALAAVEDYVMAFPQKAMSRNVAIGLKAESRYFNAGVLLFDWAACLKQDRMGQSRVLHAADPARFKANDQDVLNVVFEDAWLALPPRWNVQTGLVSIVENPAILHFTGKKKPWQKIVPWVHRKRKTVYTDDLDHLPWASFSKPASFISKVSAFLAHSGQRIGGMAKRSKVRGYFR